MRGIEPFIVFAVAAFYFPIMPRSERADQFVPDAIRPQDTLEPGRCSLTGRGEPFCKLSAVIRLDTLNRKREAFEKVFQKEGRTVRAVFLKGFHIAPAGILIQSSMLIEFLLFCLIYETDRRNEFHVNLNPLSRIVHFFIRFWDIFGIGKLLSYDSLSFKEVVKPGNRAFIPFPHELDPKDNQPRIGISASHVTDELDLFRSMLVRMGMGRLERFLRESQEPS